jgi:hypothetical protein
MVDLSDMQSITRVFPSTEKVTAERAGYQRRSNAPKDNSTGVTKRLRKAGHTTTHPAFQIRWVRGTLGRFGRDDGEEIAASRHNARNCRAVGSLAHCADRNREVICNQKILRN